MNIEKEIFKRHNIDKNKLKQYGFKLKNSKYEFETKLEKRDFKAVIVYDKEFFGKIYDLSTNDEYTNFRLENSSGFSAEIREEYINILSDIRDKCSEKQLFQTKQAQNINRYIQEKYSDQPEFLWKNFPTYAIYRSKKNNKWYALIGTVQINKVIHSSKSAEIVEILNVKVDKNNIQEILNQDGVYEAYHMNKKNWVTIIFDKSLKDSEIEKFIDNSYKNI